MEYSSITNQRSNDNYIIDEIIQQDLIKDQLCQINICRILLKMIHQIQPNLTENRSKIHL